MLDYFLTLGDEVRDPHVHALDVGLLTHFPQINHIWKKQRSWTFYAFLLVSKTSLG